MRTKPKALFITGTDTGVGKTHVSVSLVKALVKHGLRVSVMKPIASGSERGPLGLRNDDALALMEASNVDTPYATVNPYCFEPAISPHIAAEEARIEISLDTIERNFHRLSAQADFTLVEGAGGWYAPISPTKSISDLPKALNIPAILVVGIRLGCLNHAQLSKLAIEAKGVEFAGWVANAIDPTLARAAENLATLERLLGRPPLAVFPFAAAESTDQCPGMASTAGHSAAAPGSSQPTARHSAAAPSSSQPTAGHSAAAPSSSQPTAGHSASAPSSSQPTAGHSAAAPGSSQPTAGHSAAAPSSSQPTAGHSAAAPSSSQPTAKHPAASTPPPATGARPPVPATADANVHCGEHLARHLSLISF
jgi:dethiobiotin synthetase